jgi:esterase/lipase/1-acyl-sn-glycerol-3-phosphate acyltransferase
MNPFAYRTTGLLIGAISNLSKANIATYGEENIPADGAVIFVINHFTRLETFLMPYLLNRLTKKPIWSLAASELFAGAFGNYLEKVGAVSTRRPDRDRLIVKTLLTGEAHWIIFPEGHMVKNKKIVEKGQFMISWVEGKHPPHTGAATLALRTQFYRQRILAMADLKPQEAERLLERFEIDSIDAVAAGNTYLVPVNITYYPVRARENILSELANRLVDELPERVMEEIMTEGSFLVSDTDFDIRFGTPIPATACLGSDDVCQDINRPTRIDFDDSIQAKATLRKEAHRLMQQYMADIYSLTTVNPDHLFASILRAMPYHRIDAMDLRRRVYLTIEALRGHKEIYLHKSFRDDQIHLLADDKFGRAKDFFAVAVEKGVLQPANGEYRKDKTKFSSGYDFHRARLDNPIDVMANAVEPLVSLQRTVRKLSLIPRTLVRHKTAKSLIHAAEVEFEQDYKRYCIPGESKDMDVGRPYIIRGRSKRIGVVLAHGYMAAPLEVRQLAQYLSHRGFWVYAPRLKGHGTAPEDLAVRSYKDWAQSMDHGYAIMSAVCKKVVVGGFSTGAGLALDLASRIDSIAGVFAVSAPMRLKDLASRFVPAMDTWNRIMSVAYKSGPKKEFVDNKSENPHINYSRNPISGVRELDRLMDALEPRLADIDTPAMVLQSRGDPVVDPKGSRKIFELLGSEDKQYVLFNFDRHGILMKEGSERVHQTIGDFVARFR